MDTNDRQAIDALFDKLAHAARDLPARDAEAERHIAAAIARQPGAPYYLAQTVVMQNHALTAAQARIADLEAELAAAPPSAPAGFLSGLFGSGPAPRRAAPSVPTLPQGAPGGFLAGAGQTAMGVAGGLLLANGIGTLIAGAAGAAEAAPQPDPDLGDIGFGDEGDW